MGYTNTESMKTVDPGCFEIRLKGADGIYIAFYVLKTDIGILIFHSFKKKTQKTTKVDIETGKTRLKNLLKDLKNEKE